MKRILLLALGAASSVACAQEMKLLRFPTVHDKQVVFVHGGDLWTMELGSNSARRLTSNPGSETAPIISPDGSQIAFTGQYDGTNAVYVIPSEGGEPRRVTYDGRPAKAAFWVDNDTLGISQSTEGFTAGLYFVETSGSLPRATAIQEFTSGSISPDGHVVAYNRRASYAFNWRYYRGGTQGVISFYDLATNKYWEAPHGREQNYHPMWVKDQVYYISDRDLGTQNLYRFDTNSKRAVRLTNFSDTEIRNPKTDGKTIVFERGAGLYTYDIATGKVVALSPRMLGELTLRRPVLKKVNNLISGLSLSPSGKRVAFAARGDIFTVPRTGDTHNLTETQGIRDEQPTWSPDGQSIAYLTEKGGEQELWVMDNLGGDKKKLAPANQATSLQWSPDSKTILATTFDNKLLLVDATSGKVTKVDEGDYGIGSPEFSPIGDYIAYLKPGANLFGQVWIYDVKKAKSTQVSEGYFNDLGLSWDQGGKYLYVLSMRDYEPTLGVFEQTLDTPMVAKVYAHVLAKDTPNPLAPRNDEEPLKPKTPPVEAKPDAKAPAKEEPKATKIDFDGLSKRSLLLPVPGGQNFGLVGVDNGVLIATGEGLSMFSFASRQMVPIFAGGISSIAFNSDRSKFAYQLGSAVGVANVQPGVELAQGLLNTNNVEMMVEPVKEWEQIINEVWRTYRDRFYQADMVGINWNEIKNRYMPLVKYCSNRDDVNYLMGMLIGEVGTGHAYNGGGDMGMSVSNPVSVGYFGADMVADASGKVKFGKIYHGDGESPMTRNPLDEPGIDISEGNFLLAIDGKEVNAANPPLKWLQNKAGKVVTVTVNSTPSMTGAKTYKVRPLPSEEGLRYQDYVETNRKLVDKLSGGKIGYVHVPNTATEGMTGFMKGYYSQSHKQALIIDERFNGGGFIPTFFIERLKREVQSGFKGRYGSEIGFPTQSVNGPTCMLINEYAGSGGDMFPYLYKSNKIGKVFGRRTWGGLVGITGGIPLIDGGGFTVPAFGLYDIKTGKWIAENTGVDPDVDIDARPDMVAQGKDECLEAAVKHLLDELKKHPAKPLKAPPSPRNRPTGKD